ncbi:MAG: hypothetical protein H0T47_18585 [Planctomycetaceae bacterium]|nr:hypothetical protein [Planctomycetaceae bacterium]
MTEHQKILVECLRRTRLLEAGLVTEHRSFWFQPDLEYEAEHGPIWHAGKWFGGGERLAEAQRQRFVRSLHQLAASGRVVLARKGGTHVTNVRLTASGRVEAERLSAGVKVSEIVTVSAESAIEAPCRRT